jgi:DNA-binding NtrC family response regulator
VLTVPPLRARCGEIVALAERFAAGAARELGQTGIQISEAARAALLARPWPGNVRELRNAIERAVLLARDGLIGPQHLPGTAAAPVADQRPEAGDRRALVLEALAACGGNQKLAAQRLGINRRTLARWLDQLAILRPRISAA